MKNEVKKFVRSHGCSAHYSGKKRTMFIKGEKSAEIEEKALVQFGFNLSFKLDGVSHLKKTQQ